MEEMQKFIDECNVMVDTMKHCEEGWVALEQEMVDSVDSFADRIVYTEGLIMEEADLILDMADRIVQTEEIVYDLIESCNCSDSSSNPPKKKTIDNQETDSFSLDVKINDLSSKLSNWIPKDIAHASSPDVPPLNADRCTAMDEIIEVMDSCIKTFETYNDDFLEVLSYMVSWFFTFLLKLLVNDSQCYFPYYYSIE